MGIAWVLIHTLHVSGRDTETCNYMYHVGIVKTCIMQDFLDL